VALPYVLELVSHALQVRLGKSVVTQGEGHEMAGNRQPLGRGLGHRKAGRGSVVKTVGPPDRHGGHETNRKDQESQGPAVAHGRLRSPPLEGGHDVPAMERGTKR
jgi:hypothetical protein